MLAIAALEAGKHVLCEARMVSQLAVEGSSAPNCCEMPAADWRWAAEHGRRGCHSISASHGAVAVPVLTSRQPMLQAHPACRGHAGRAVLGRPRRLLALRTAGAGQGGGPWVAPKLSCCLGPAAQAMNAAEARAMLAASMRRPDLTAQLVPSPITLPWDAAVQDIVRSGR